MSRDFQDHDETAEDQAELAFAPDGSRRAAREAEPPRAEFFRPQRRPILPIVGLVGAVATVALFLWLGRDESPQPEGVPEAAQPMASAPAGEEALADAASPAAVPGPVAELEAPAPAAPAAAATPPADPDPLAPDPSVLGPSAGLPPVAAAAAPAAAEPAPVAAAAAAAQVDRPPAVAAPARKAAPSAGRGGYSVQLLAARSETQVGGAWQKLRGAHPDLLASLSPSVSATERAGNGTFYRLRAGPLQDRAAADALCRQLSARHQSCFVVSPGS